MANIQRRNLLATDVLKHLYIALGVTFLGCIGMAAMVYAQAEDVRPHDISSVVQAEFAKCRKLESQISRTLCECDVIEKQCNAPREPDHGNWITAEYWPNDNPDDREVKFVLPYHEDLFDTVDANSIGIIMTCRSGDTKLRILPGRELNLNSKPFVMVGNTLFQTSYETVGDAWVIEFDDTDGAIERMRKNDALIFSVQDSDGRDFERELKTTGFKATTEAWDSLCVAPKSKS